MSEPIPWKHEYKNPMVDVLGQYADYRQSLNADRKREWMNHLEQVFCLFKPDKHLNAWTQSRINTSHI